MKILDDAFVIVVLYLQGPQQTTQQHPRVVIFPLRLPLFPSFFNIFASFTHLHQPPYSHVILVIPLVEVVWMSYESFLGMPF